MPDRIIKESICTSETLNQLTDFEERFWNRLTVNCDDYGRFDARPAILKGRLFPLMDGKTHKDMTAALSRLASVGLVELYEVDGRPFLQVVTWSKHQRIRAKRSKFPSPAESCRQVTADGVECLSNPNQSESNPNPNPNDSAEPASGSTPPVCLIPLNTGAEYPISEAQVNEWKTLYPAVDVVQELREMRGWCLANKSKRKTAAGVLRFITGWLSREQDQGGSKRHGTAASPDTIGATEADGRRWNLQSDL